MCGQGLTKSEGVATRSSASTDSRGSSNWGDILWFRRVDDRGREAGQNGARSWRERHVNRVDGQLETLEGQAAVLLGLSNPSPRIDNLVAILELHSLVHVGMPPQELVNPAREYVLAIGVVDDGVETILGTSEGG